MNRPTPTLPNPHEPLRMNGDWRLEVVALVLQGLAILFWAYAVLTVTV